MEKQLLDMPHQQFNPRESWDELEQFLDQELSALPEQEDLSRPGQSASVAAAKNRGE